MTLPYRVSIALSSMALGVGEPRAVALTIGVLFVSAAMLPAAQTPPVFPTIDVRASIQPRPLNAGGVTHFAYELYITNLAPFATTIDAVEARDAAAASNAAPLLRLEGAALDAAIRRLGHPLFLWIKARDG